jgi:hypothetical protein
LKSGTLNFLEPSGPVQACNGIALPLPNNTAMKQFYTNRSDAKCWLDIYRCGAGLTVTGQMHDIAQNDLWSSFETGNSISPVTVTFCYLSRFSRKPLLEIYVFFVALRPNAGHGLLILEVF